MSYLLYNESFDKENDAVNLKDAVNLAIETDSLSNYYFIVPTGRQVRWLRNKVIYDYYTRYNKPTTNINLFTLQSLIRHCFNNLFRHERFHIISDAYRLALFEEAALKAELKYFKKNAGKLSYNLLIRLSDLIQGLRKEGLSSKELFNEVSGNKGGSDLIFDKLRLSDVASLLMEYENILGAKYLDEPEILRLVNNTLNGLSQIDSLLQGSYKIGDADFDLSENYNINLETLHIDAHNKSINRVLNEKTKLIFAGFSEFKLPEIEFLSHFAITNGFWKGFSTAINITYSLQNGPLFGNLNDTIKNLINIGYKALFLDEYSHSIESKEWIPVLKVMTIVDTHIGDNTDIKAETMMQRSAYLRRWLFNSEKELRHSGFSEIISIIAADNKLDEVSSIAKLVKYLNEKKGIKLHEICIALRVQENYTTLYREIFALNSLPVNISDRYDLSKSPIVISIFSVLDIINYDFRREDIHRALQSPYLKFKKDSVKDGKNILNNKIDGALIYDTAKKLRIIGGKKYGGYNFWIKRLKARIESLGNSIRNIEDVIVQDELEIHNLIKFKTRLEKALESMEVLGNLIPRITKKIWPDEFKKLIIKDIIEKLKIRESIIEHYQNLIMNKHIGNKNEEMIFTDEIEKDSRALSQFLRILDEMTFIIKDREQGKKFTFDELYQKLKTSVAGSKYQIKEKPKYGVNITSIEQTRGIPFKVLILSGAVDGEFPLRYRSEILLGKELKDSEQKHIQSERMLFYQFLTNNEDGLNEGQCRIYIFYPKAEQGEELVRSPFIDDLLKITTIESDNRIYDLNTLRIHHKNRINATVQENEWVDAITNNSDLLKYISKKNKLKEQFKTYIDFSQSFQDSFKYLSIYKSSKERQPGIIDKRFLTDITVRILDSFSNSPISVNDLETYSKCPYKFFVKKILKIEEPTDEDTSLSALEKGNLMHLILHKFYTLLQRKYDDGLKTLPNPVRLELKDIESYKKILKRLAQKEIEKIKFVHPFFELDEIALFGRNELKGWLEYFLDNEISRINSGWRFEPIFFELGFGFGKKSLKENSLPPIEIADGLNLRGKVDRVEIHRDSDNVYICISDYKTGSNVDSLGDIIRGVSFQMPLYILAVKNILKNYFNIEAIPGVAVYLRLKPIYQDDKIKAENIVFAFNKTPVASFLSERSKSKLDESAITHILSTSVEYAKNIISKVTEGEFPILPHKNECRWCNYFPICRIKKN